MDSAAKQKAFLRKLKRQVDALRKKEETTHRKLLLALKKVKLAKKKLPKR